MIDIETAARLRRDHTSSYLLECAASADANAAEFLRIADTEADRGNLDVARGYIRDARGEGNRADTLRAAANLEVR